MTVAKDIKILLVEDAKSMRKIEVKILRSIGFENILEANDGVEAVEIIESTDGIDLVISDWNMPNMSGYELLVAIRQNEQYQDVPFIMATAQADKEQAQKAESAGCSGFIPKPFSAGELKDQIEMVFGEEQTEPEDAEAAGPQKSASGKVKLRVAHIQITDHLILGVLKSWIEQGEIVPKHFELETQCMAGWNPVEQALEKGDVDAAFVLAPIAMDLFHFGTPIKMVLLAHRNGSIFVRNKQGDYLAPYEDFFKKKSVLIPHKMSVHHMLTHMFFNPINVKPSLDKDDDVDINLEVVAPINMTPFMKENSEVGGFVVAEPMGSKSVASGVSEKLFLSSEIWPNHPCCVVTVRDDFSEPHSEAVQEFVECLVKAGKFVAEEGAMAAFAAVRFLDPDKKLDLKIQVLKKVLTDPLGITTDNLFPVKADIDKMQRYMHDNMGVGHLIDMDAFVDTQYAEKACPDFNPDKYSAELLNTEEVITSILSRSTGDSE
ncbi:MAG: ABC transporter substrate-binding protein [Deltaproteobacteria bacterium]|nr:ABC transporter substrate-binding protein [Deltaproteobacteria bacterium]MBT7156012.1 ABC transporter substrate-binding protein [Deltaproteobacteria bacterium]